MSWLNKCRKCSFGPLVVAISGRASGQQVNTPQDPRFVLVEEVSLLASRTIVVQI